MNRVVVLALVVLNLSFVAASNISFKLSALSPGWREFLKWQVVGNVAGFLGVLSLTGMLRYLPLHLGYGISAGLGLLAVEVVGARWLLHEEITPAQWVGVVLTAVGVSLLAWGRR